MKKGLVAIKACKGPKSDNKGALTVNQQEGCFEKSTSGFYPRNTGIYKKPTVVSHCHTGVLEGKAKENL
jgi:hypothetical protein